MKIWKALAEIYTMHSFAPFSNLKFFVNYFAGNPPLVLFSFACLMLLNIRGKINVVIGTLTRLSATDWRVCLMHADERKKRMLQYLYLCKSSKGTTNFQHMFVLVFSKLVWQTRHSTVDRRISLAIVFIILHSLQSLILSLYPDFLDGLSKCHISTRMGLRARKICDPCVLGVDMDSPSKNRLVQNSCIVMAGPLVTDR